VVSGLANSKTVAVQPSAGEDKAVVLSTTKTKKQNTPAKLQHKTLMRKEFRKMAKSVKNQVLQLVVLRSHFVLQVGHNFRKV